MKKFLFITLAGALTLAACTKDYGNIVVTSSVDDVELVNLNFSTYSTEPMTKAPVDLTSLITRLDVYIIEGTDTLIVNQVKNEDAGFGSVTASLKKTKTYTLYAIGHKGYGPAELDGSSLSFPDNRITDTFFYSGTFCPGNTTSLNCTMNRIVGMFKLTITDELPEDLAKVQFSISETALGYNVGSGSLANVSDRLVTINNPSSAQDGSTTFKIYALATSAASSIDVTVTALSAEDDVIEERIFQDVPIKAGYISAYTGTFFITTGMSLSFVGPEDWASFESQEY